MIASPARIAEVRTGSVAPLGRAGVTSAYRKAPRAGMVMAGPLGLAKDEQADPRVHGGPDKAIYGYPVSGYADWAAEFPALAPLMAPGAMGENLVIEGVDETGLHIGDRIRAGAALLQVSQIRQPCHKLATVLGEPAVIAAMIRSGRCGWYYRVLEAGPIGPGDGHAVIDRPNPDWPVRRFAEIVAARAAGRELLADMLAMEGLAEGWKLKALRQLAEARDAPGTP